MIWSVRNPSSDQSLPQLIHKQLRKNIILSTQLKSKVTHLVRLMIGTGALTGIFLYQSVITA